MNLDHYKLIDARKLRDNMNIDRRARKGEGVFWVITIICLVTFAYLAVFDERFQEVKHEVRR